MGGVIDRDPLCMAEPADGHPKHCDQCTLIREVRADERKRIAQDVDALRHVIDQAAIGWQLPRDAVRALHVAADRIARGDG